MSLLLFWYSPDQNVNIGYTEVLEFDVQLDKVMSFTSTLNKVVTMSVELDKVISFTPTLNKVVAMDVELNKVVSMTTYAEMESTA